MPFAPFAPPEPFSPFSPFGRQRDVSERSVPPASLRQVGVTRPGRSGSPGKQVSGDDILKVAKKRIGENYVWSARAPMANAKYKGPWDCAEFCSWTVYQATEILYGVHPNHDPIKADAYTGWWNEDSLEFGERIDPAEAIAIGGACLLRAPAGPRGGHIAFSDGKGGTIEARGEQWGVCKHKAGGRRWDCGVLIPGVLYFRSENMTKLEPVTAPIYRLTQPMMRGPKIKKIQKKLDEGGFSVGSIDGIFGGQTTAALISFQTHAGITPDGEIGPDTWEALFG